MFMYRKVNFFLMEMQSHAMSFAQVEEMKLRLDEKNRLIEKKTQAAMQAQQDRNRINTELTELKDHMDIKDRKINVLQRKVSNNLNFTTSCPIFLLLWKPFA